MQFTERPLRSCLYMPGSNARALEKGQGLVADCLIFDLEDAVAPDQKDAARQQVVLALANNDYGDRLCAVRVNHHDSDNGRADVEALAGSGADALLFPKIDTAGDVDAITCALDAAGAGDMPVWIMIETPGSILNLGQIAACAARTRLTGLVVGTNDLAKETGMQLTPEREAFRSALSMCVFAARANGLVALDGVYNDIGNTDGLESELAQTRMFGFDGKTLIHPSQLEPCNRLLAPEETALAEAQAIVDAFSLPENSGKGVLKVGGKMTERLHLEMAQTLLKKAAVIKARS